MTKKATKRSADATNGVAVRAPVRGLLKGRAYDEIKQLILSGELAPGLFLAERQLAGQLGMSTTPVRSALERLESEGFVSISPQQGAVVRDFSVHEIADQYEIRAALETFIVRSLAGRLTAEQERRVSANLEAQRLTLRAENVEASVQLDEEFHGLFCEFLGNREILRVMGHLREKTHRLIFRVFTTDPGRIASSYKEHQGIAQAITQGDPALAARRVEEHLEYGKLALLSPRRL